MAQRVGLALVICLSAAAPLLAADATVSVEVLMTGAVVNVGEPFGVTIRIANAGEASLTTTQRALSMSELWPYLELTRVPPDGSEVAIPTDRALPTPFPPSQWAMRDGTLVAVSPAAVLAPGDSVDLALTNLLRYFPLLEPGQYRLGLAYGFPVYDETITDPAYGDASFVVLGDERRVLPTVTQAFFALELPEGVTNRDVEWFRAARAGFVSSRVVADAVGAFALVGSSTSAYLQACSQYWTGEAYELYGDDSEAAAAYEAVLAQFSESLFAVYAERRLEEIAALREAQSP